MEEKLGFAEYGNYDALGLAELVRKGDVSPSEVIEEAIERSQKLNPKLNFLTVEAYDEGRRMAADPSLPDGPFKGVPWLVKELATPWNGQPMTNSSPYMKDLVASFDSDLVAKTKQAGFTLLGKSNSPELGWALSSESPLFGTTKNPWDMSLTPDGSSGGAAAAIASGVLPIAEASDGGGSIRVPASHSGLVGLKPSRGRISMGPSVVDFWYGGATFLCLSRTVRDTAAYLDVVNGSLPGEPYYCPIPETPFLIETSTHPGKLKLALVLESPANCTPIDKDVRNSIEDTGKVMGELGHIVEAQSIPYDFWDINDCYTRITAVATAAWIDAMEEFVGRSPTEADFSPLYWTMIEKGRSISGIQHANDVEKLRMVCRDMVGKMAEYDAWIMPTIPVPAREHGWYDMSSDVDNYNNTRMGPDSPFSAPFNASGLPAISLPLHISKGGLPIGTQLVGKDQSEAVLLRVAAQLEQALPWIDRKPTISV